MEKTQYTPEEIEMMEANMDDTMRKYVEIVKKDLKDTLDGNWDTFETLTDTQVHNYLFMSGLTVPDQFKKAMTTPFAIAKFLMLKIEQDNLVKEILVDLNGFLDSDKIGWIVHEDFSSEITFYPKTTKIDTAQPTLVVKYKKDDEDHISYALKSTRSWPISKKNLKALLEGGEVTNSSAAEDLKPTVTKMSPDTFEFTLGELFTITCKKS